MVMGSGRCECGMEGIFEGPVKSEELVLRSGVKKWRIGGSGIDACGREANVYRSAGCERREEIHDCGEVSEGERKPLHRHCLPTFQKANTLNRVRSIILRCVFIDFVEAKSLHPTSVVTMLMLRRN